MRSSRVFTNLTCNQNCTTCTDRRAREEPAFVQPAAVLSRIDRAASEGAQEIVLTGGEPTLRRDLEALVAHARSRGVEVGLETNATTLDAARAAQLASAGLSRARVNLAGWSAPDDAMTRDPGGALRTESGLAALLDAGVIVDAEALVVRSSLRGLAALPGRVAALTRPSGARVSTLFARVPVSSADPSELVSYEVAAAALAALDEAARKEGVAVKLAPDSGPPPCVFAHPSRVAHLYAMTPGARPRDDHRRVPACEACQLRDRCSGFATAYLARWPAPSPRPITEDRVRRRLSLITSVEAQIARELVQPSRFERPDTGVVDERLIRINFHCNQACRFCFVSTHLPPAGDAAVRRAIEEAGAAGARVVLTGGEPTLNARLAEYVALAARVSRHPVGIQTNAVRLADPALTRAVVEAGVADAFVSLHGSTAEISDAITEAPGTFDKTVIGLDHLHAHASVQLTLNFVMHQRNLDDLVPYVRFVAARWPRAAVTLSFVAPSSDVVPRSRDLVPRYSDALPSVARAIEEAARLGVTLGGFESMCGLPLCLLPTSLAGYASLTDIPEGYDGGEFVRTAACERCALVGKCYGLRRGYLALHGDAELRPVAPLAPG
ncbi:MAG: radical SAM protein [Polyangiaceae bacterium]|nr:radical SAM protein [Polyangiaceae bacterium]